MNLNHGFIKLVDKAPATYFGQCLPILAAFYKVNMTGFLKVGRLSYFKFDVF
jgi:hypothetical protein